MATGNKPKVPVDGADMMVEVSREEAIALYKITKGDLIWTTKDCIVEIFPNARKHFGYTGEMTREDESELASRCIIPRKWRKLRRMLRRKVMQKKQDLQFRP